MTTQTLTTVLYASHALVILSGEYAEVDATGRFINQSTPRIAHMYSGGVFPATEHNWMRIGRI